MKKLMTTLAVACGLAASTFAATVNLANVSGNTTLADGDVATGTLGGNYRISIAAGATVTLRDVTINGVHNENYTWAGITCAGNATIVLDGANTVRGFHLYYPGIYVPSGKTLKIRGTGSLNASSNGQAPGIGAARSGMQSGNIEIESGTIIATGGDYAAGIGGAYIGHCGNITISGGTVTATGGSGAAGIGSGSSSSNCGNISIGLGVARVYAEGGTGARSAIGAGKEGTCASVTVDSRLMMDSISDVTRTIVGNLSALDRDVTVGDGRIITGTLSGNHKISIAHGATVTLRNATILGIDGISYRWAGITCEGDASVILQGENRVRGFYREYPGLFVPSDRTLMISGTGSLEASSNGKAAGIGAGYDMNCGSIAIEGGAVSAVGGYESAGIGGAYSANCDNISIGPGITRVTATRGSGIRANPIGIGYGTCGAITVDSSLLDSTIGMTRTIGPWTTGDLSGVSEDTTLEFGTRVSGELGGNYKISIADGATVAFYNVAINGVNNPSCEWAGVTCLGDATIILYGTNTVRGFYENHPGIFVPVGKTLTIKGRGSLEASSNGYGAGIGGGYNIGRGDIVIEDGVITATGGKFAAGIGSGWSASAEDVDGSITFLGGTVTATGGEGAAGIGGGKFRTCGSVEIYGGTVTATGGENASGIGNGESGVCEYINVGLKAIRVTATCGSGGTAPIAAGQDGDQVFVSNLFSDKTIGQTRILSTKSVDLSALTGDAAFADGATVAGELSRYCMLTIDDGATVTLRDVTIRGVSSTLYEHAGITCLGDATIVLEGTNTVQGFISYYPGISVPVGKTLTIRGSGSLTAYSNGQGAGIGGGRMVPCGNIVIEGGNITVIGGDDAAGIGGGSAGDCGNITILGGTIFAKGGYGAAGVGCGRSGTGGSIAVAGGVVDAKGGTLAAAIGCGEKSSCGAIAFGAGATLVTATPGGSHDNAIGNGRKGLCSVVLVDSALDDSLSGQTRILSARNVGLSSLTVDMTVVNGSVLTGSLGGNSKVTIADGATVTLRDVTIDGVDDEDCGWAGITCLGDATIILDGVNFVKGFYHEHPGIYVPVGKTLTLAGSGSLTAYSNGNAAGIGAGYGLPCGNIVIEGGTVVATGGRGAAGIGGGDSAEGCGTVTITRGVTRVTAAKGEDAPYSIGRGDSGTGGAVTIDGVAGEIAESPYTYYGQAVDLSSLSSNYTAADGDVLRGETTRLVTVPGGATVTINGVAVSGAGGGAAGIPSFAADGKAATTEFVKGASGKWTLTTFAELSNDALGKDVADGQIKVYASGTLEGLKTASPMTSGVTVKGKKSAVMTTIEVTPPGNPDSQFFKVKFGE